MKRPPLQSLASRSFTALPFIGLPLAALLVSGPLLEAAPPPDPALEMTFSEGTGTSTANSGFLAGSALLDAGTTTNGFPRFTNNVPTGIYAPTGNTYSIDFGPVELGQGGRKVDLTTTASVFPSGTLGSFIGGLTVCGWLNSRDNAVGSGGNRVAFALEGPGSWGFDVMQRGGGAMGFNVNQYNDGGPTSSEQMVTQDAGAATNNWTFFAITYDTSTTSGQVKFHFGRGDKLAAFDAARTYSGGLSNEIDITGALTIGNFSIVEGAYSAVGTGSRTYRGLIDQLRIYTNVMTIDEIQQAQLESSTVPPVPATFLRQPTNVTMVAGPFKTATFRADAHGSGLVTYQWLTNGVAMAGATNSSLTLPADSVAYNSTVINVRIDNALTADPGVLSSNAVLTVTAPPTPDGVITASADVFYDNAVVYNAYSQSKQINWGLAGSSSLTTGRRRSYMVFTLGTQPVAAAKVKLWNYWGGPAVNGEGRLAQATTRIYGALTNAPIVITEPPAGSHATITGFDPPNNTNFFAIAPDQLVGPSIGWYEWDVTAWYNACLGQTTTIMLRANATSGYDFPLYEDREGTALTAGAGGTAANTGPRIEYFLPPAAPPQFATVKVTGGQVVMTGSGGPASGTFYLLASPDVAAPVGSWTRASTNQFDASGNFSVSVAIPPGATQSYYRLQLP